MSIAIFTRLHAKPGRRSDLLAVLDELARSTRAEPGNEEFVTHAARDNDDLVLGYERFIDEAAIEAHRATEAVARARAQLDELLTEPPEIVYASD